MVNFADLVLPDTTYLERFDTISCSIARFPSRMRPRTRFAPLVKTENDVRPWQEVLVERPRA